MSGEASATPSDVAKTSVVASTPLSGMLATEQLMYATVRLSNQTGTNVRWGTGLLFNLFYVPPFHVPVIITNRHVIEGWDHCHFALVSALADGSPDLTTHINVEITNLASRVLYHPSVDLAIITLAASLREIETQGRRFVGAFFYPHLILTDDLLKALMPVEQILTVGYPGRLWDDVHNLPVFHRGYTATAPYIDFQGRKEFLIDIAVWPGASGSPVILFNDGLVVDRRHHVSLGETRVALLGIAFGAAVGDVTGNVRIQAGATQITAPSQLQVPINLGACIKASRILEFEPLLVSHGLSPPADYVMRAR